MSDPRPLPIRPERRGWRNVAVVAGVISFVTVALLLASHFRASADDPIETASFLELKKELQASPNDEALKERIRTLDLELRTEFFRERRFRSLGGRVLLVSILVLLTALRRASRVDVHLPDVPEGLEIPDDGGAGSRRARLAVGSTAALVALGAIALGLTAGGAPPWAASADEESEGPVLTWTRFRGPEGAGIAPEPDVPVSWNVETGQNIVWKTPVPKPGVSSPLVWGERIFLTGGTADVEEVYAFELATGSRLWTAVVEFEGERPEAPEVLLEDTGFAVSTGVVDANRVYSQFVNGYLVAHDHEGKQLWVRNFGPFDNHYGHGASLALHRQHLIVQIDEGTIDDGKARLLALSTSTGETVWKTPREVDASWTTPIVIRPEGLGTQIITCSSPLVAAYDPASGGEIWRAECLSGEVSASPILAGGKVVAVHMDADLCAIRPDGKGDVTESHVEWKAEDNLPDVCTPVSDGQLVWTLSSDGWATCYDLADGSKIWEHELELDFYSSPSLAGDRLYMTSRKGVTVVMAAGREAKEIARSELGEAVDASFAFVGSRFLIRGLKHLYMIGTP